MFLSAVFQGMDILDYCPDCGQPIGDGSCHCYDDEPDPIRTDPNIE